MSNPLLFAASRTLPVIASSNPATLVAYSVLVIGASIAHRILTSGDVSNVEVGTGGVKANFYPKKGNY